MFEDDARSNQKTDSITIVNLTATASAASARQLTSGKKRGGLAFLNVTAVGGVGPSMTVVLETSDDNGVNWYPLPGGTFTAATAVSRQILTLGQLGADIRANYAITGTTPSISFTVRCIA